jgi:radical SAM superfamily enzyme YgiQ (UPF0313 family)
MVLHASHDGTSYTISLTAHSVAVGVGDETVASWDRGGRLYSLVRDDATWRRGLNGVIVEKRREAGRRVHRFLAGAAADAVVDEAAAIAKSVSHAMAAPVWTWHDGIDAVTAQDARTMMTRVSTFGAPAARVDAERFARVYRPVGILPPDQYLALVLQATEGCSFNTCTFCDLYHEPYRVKTAAEFRAHVADVRAYLGESLGLRSHGIFLGAANALAVPMARLVPIFEVLVEDADALRLGVSAFVDGFTGAIKTTRDYRVLADMGLRRVYVGLESGHDPLLEFVRKPATSRAAIDTVRAIKAAGVGVGVIVMTGLGGDRFADAHVADTAATLTAMHLDRGDLLYFSALVEHPHTTYPRLAVNANIRALDGAACEAQRAEMLAAARFDAGGPQTATYDIREFVY